jgi:hypothetical protein
MADGRWKFRVSLPCAFVLTSHQDVETIFGKHLVYLAVLFCLLTAVPLRAATGGSISGAVTDPSGAVIPGAALKLVTFLESATEDLNNESCDRNELSPGYALCQYIGF